MNSFACRSVALEQFENESLQENEFFALMCYNGFGVDFVQAIQNQREVEALRKNLTFCLEAKEKLERYKISLLFLYDICSTSCHTADTI